MRYSLTNCHTEERSIYRAAHAKFEILRYAQNDSSERMSIKKKG